MTPEGIKFTKEQWIPALRSGQYEQGVGKLHDKDNRFCCLGVACDLLKDKLSLEVREGTCSYKYDYSEVYLPEAVENYIGLIDTSQDELANLNDTGNTFNQIADALEDMIAKQVNHVPVSH